MEKVYLVEEKYGFDGVETNVNVFSTYEKAKEFFDKITKIEIEQTWIADIVECKENGDDYIDDTFELSKNYLHAYDGRNFYSTTISITEKEIDKGEYNA